MQNQHAHTQSLQEKPEVSFIVTAYNLPAEMLRECLESILALDIDEKRREIILVDDGSDETPLTELKDLVRHIIYYRQDNQGVSAARNAGLRIATGKFIQFIDGDDLLIPENYQHCLKILDEKQPDIVIFNADTKQKGVLGPFQGDEYMRQNNLKSAVWTYIFRRELIGKLHFTVGKKYTEDEEFTPQLLLRAEEIYIISEKAYFYRQHKESATQKSVKNDLEKRLNDSLDTIFALNEKSRLLPQGQKQAMDRRVAQLTMDHLYNTARFTRSREKLEETIQQLRKKNLFPLSDQKYTRKYSLFRLLVSSGAGRKLLILTAK